MMLPGIQLQLKSAETKELQELRVQLEEKTGELKAARAQVRKLHMQLADKTSELSLARAQNKTFCVQLEEKTNELFATEAKFREVSAISLQHLVHAAQQTVMQLDAQDGIMQGTASRKRRGGGAPVNNGEKLSKKTDKTKLVKLDQTQIYAIFLNLKPFLGVSQWTFKDAEAAANFWIELCKTSTYTGKSGEALDYSTVVNSATKLLRTYGYIYDHGYSKTPDLSLTWSWDCKRAVGNSLWLSHKTEFDEQTKNAISHIGKCFRAKQDEITLHDTDQGFVRYDIENAKPAVDAYLYQHTGAHRPFEARKPDELCVISELLIAFRDAGRIVELKTAVLRDPEQKIKQNLKI